MNERRKLLDHLIGIDAAFLTRLQPHDDPADVVADHTASALPCGRENRLDIGTFLDDRLDLAHALLEVGESRAFGRDDVAEKDAGVLPRNEPLRDYFVEVDDGHQKCQ